MDARRDGILRVRAYWRLSVAINLWYFAFPIQDIVTGSHTPAARAAATAGLVLFALFYVPAIVTGWFRPDGERDPVVRIVVCTALGIALTLGLGMAWYGLLIYCAHLAGASVRRPVPVVAAIAATAAVTLWAVTADPVAGALAAGFSLLVGLYAVAFGWIVDTYRELDRARSELARLAVADERLRFSRDLHDLLGHSLSVIALKSELAGRLIGTDPARATAEIHDIEAVTREALTEVRAAVSGYRGSVGLAAELRRARSALAAAGVDAEIDEPTASLPAEVESLLAWTVREGATNIVRHAGASRATIRVHSGDGGAGVELLDDGTGGSSPHIDDSAENGSGQNDSRQATVDGTGPAGRPRNGNGLSGLAERVAAAAGAFEAGRAPGGGFRLAVRVPR